MRVTQALARQHMGFWFKTGWNRYSKRRVKITEAENQLKKRGIPVEDPLEFLKEKATFEKLDVVGLKPKPIPFDQTHPQWHDKVLLTYKDNNVLLEGLVQAKILTNTVQLKDGLPDSYEPKEITRELNRRAKAIVLGAHVFDAEQKKLPKIKDPERPAFNLPRVYGITQKRAFKLLVDKLLNAIETTSDYQLVKDRYLADDVLVSFPFQKGEDNIQFQLLADKMLLSKQPLPPITENCVSNVELPDIDPIKPTITLNEENIYVVENIYPIKSAYKYHPHTLFINLNEEEVKNLFEEQVTEDQIYARTLLKAFTVAAAYAREQFGENIKTLPKPVTLQAIQTDGQHFHFGVYQLNTLDLEDDKTRNYWYQSETLKLFDKCAYEAGKPLLEGYNRDVIKQILHFYNNV